ncbi:MAG: hypothetical protein ACHQPI_09045, partial [Thermoanaerobaculia bacterium]
MRIVPPLGPSNNRGDMDRDTARRLVWSILISSFASTAAAQTQPSPAPTPDMAAPLREEVQRLQKEVDSLKARLRECSSSAALPAAAAASAAPAAAA